MVSSGISGNITAVRPTNQGNNVSSRETDNEFANMMAQTMSDTIATGSFDLGNTLADKTASSEVSSLVAKQSPSYAKMNQIDYSMVEAKNSVNKGEIKDTTKKDSSIQKDKESSDVKKDQAVDQKEIKTVEDKANTKEAKDAVAKIKETICQELDVTPEEIQAALDALGMTLSDLLDDTNLQDFVVEITGVESSVDLLVSEDLSNALETISDMLENLQDELSWSDFAQVIDTVDFMEEPVVEVAPEMKEHVNMVLEQDKNLLSSKDFNMPNTTTTQNSSQTTAGTLETPHLVVESVSETPMQNMDSNSMMDPNTMANPFLAQMTEAVKNSAGIQEIAEVTPAQIVEQIVEQAKIRLTGDASSMEMVLNPEHLGKINMNISVKEGVVTASFIAQNEAVKAAIESQMVVLRENLNQQGLKISAVEVTVENQALNTNAQAGQGFEEEEQRGGNGRSNRRNLRLDGLLEGEPLSEEEEITLDMMSRNGNQVNFTA
ncbi:MAG: flagellar hook-length control protein FliK [Lachnospiraceae bacterium]|nr:flagellar hook-length control protein FliK [Lachnospiraceae bacterium]